MSSCEKYQEMISRMVDGELSADEKHELSAHIEACPSCSMLFQAFFSISREMGSDLEDAPLDLRDSVMAEIQRMEIRRRNRIPTILRAVMSAAACVAVILGVYLGVSMAQGKSLITAAYETAPVEQKSVIPAEAPFREAVAQEASLSNAPELAAPAPALGADAPLLQATSIPLPEEEALEKSPADAETAEQAEEPSEEPAEEAQPSEDTEVSDSVSAEEPAPIAADVPEWKLSGWDLSLLRVLLGGSPTELSPEELEPSLIGRIRLENADGSYTVPIYERDGVLYYLDPTEEIIFQAELTPEALEAFFGN